LIRFSKIPKPTAELLRQPADTVQLFLTSQTLQDVAKTLEVHPGHLKRWLYEYPGHAGYVNFNVPKKRGGHRRISVPPNSLKILQAKFKTILDQVYEPKNCVYGFVADRSIVGGAGRHKKRARWILNIDIKDFYPSVNFGRIQGLFKSLGIAHKAASIWAHLVTFEGVLPQGASTSPVISNMIARQLDNKMVGLAREFHLRYTRYADDMSLSTTEVTFPPELVTCVGTGLNPKNVKLSTWLIEFFKSVGFEINTKKTRLYSKAVRQEITGLTVNEFVNVRRSFIRQIRAMIYAADKFGFTNAGREYIREYAPTGRIPLEVLESDSFDSAAYFKQVIYGKLAFLRAVRGKTDKCYVNFCLKLSKIDPNPPKQIMEIKKMYEEFDVFICHASEDKNEVAVPLFDALTELSVPAFIDVEYIKWGDSFVEKINHALSRAKLVIVVLSLNSVDKAWPKKEINSALAREIEGQTKVLPLMVGDENIIRKLLDKLPLLQDKLYKTWSRNPSDVAEEIKSLLA